MTSWPEVPTPDGDLATMREAQQDLGRRAQAVHSESVELQRIAHDVSSDWLGRTAETFTARVALARTAVEGVADTHREAARLIGTHCDEWDIAEAAAVRSRDDIEYAFADYVREGQSRASTLAQEIRDGIESLDDSVEDIPVIGGLASKVTGVATDGAGWLAEELIERLLDWNPSTPTPVLQPVVTDEVELDTAGTIASSVSGVEWGIDRLLDGIDTVIDFIGGAIEWAVDALHAIGDVLVDSIAASLRFAQEAMTTLLALGAQIAVSVDNLITETSQIVFDALNDAYVASVEFLVTLGMDFNQVLDFMNDVNGTLTYAAVLAIRSVFARQDRRMSEDEAKSADRQALRELLRGDGKLAHVRDLSDLAASAYHDTGAPDGWDRVQNYPGTDGFFAAAFRNTETGDVVLAFRGSEPNFDIKDWRDDVINANNLPTAQAQQAIDVSKTFANDFQGSDLSLSGHSLGASLASTASIATGIPASTYNAAGVGDSNYAIASGQHRSDFGTDPSERQITNYSTSNDILTEGQNALGLRPASGAQVTIQSTTDDGPEPFNPRNPLSGPIDDLIDSGKGHSQGSFDWDSVGGRPR